MVGRDRIAAWRIEALQASIRNHGWSVDSLGMTDEEAATHFANDVELDEFYRLAIRSFHKFKLEFLARALGPDYIAAHTFFEVGDSDGLVLKALGKSGRSINNDPRCIELIRRNGVEADLGLGEGVNAADNSYDVAISFETLEHSLNPLAFLKEMCRIARQKIVISVPGVTRTLIHPRIAGARIGEEHVFEFCSRDLVRLTTHLSLRLAQHSKFSVFMPPASPVARFFYSATRGRDLFGGCFRWFDFYVFDVVDGDQGRPALESAAVYFERQ